MGVGMGLPTFEGTADRLAGAAVGEGRVLLTPARAQSIPWPAAHSPAWSRSTASSWEPLGRAVGEVARVLAAGGTLATVTHTWAIEKRAPLGAWTADTIALFEHCGLVEIAQRTATFRSAPAWSCARMLRHRNRMAP